MTITAKPNKQTRTFTIRVYRGERDVTKYKTITLSREEFQSCLHHTQNDWKQFLKSDDYYLVS